VRQYIASGCRTQLSLTVGPACCYCGDPVQPAVLTKGQASIAWSVLAREGGSSLVHWLPARGMATGGVIKATLVRGVGQYPVEGCGLLISIRSSDLIFGQLGNACLADRLPVSNCEIAGLAGLRRVAVIIECAGLARQSTSPGSHSIHQPSSASLRSA